SIHRDLQRLAYATTARLAILPLQDILGFGADCRMNCPGSTASNWAWRCAAAVLTPALSHYLYHEVIFYNRGPAAGAVQGQKEEG
ncbi:MAG: 4-alpha-glucanotransferase, partial [Deltaproteobacteria bacterium]|nr:4-alpha-glucanotransferase [Deltaproteobacteria bacterium]